LEHLPGQNPAMLVIAHRGASAVERENTPAAFRRADELGADGVELDVRVAPDGDLVVAHDPIGDARATAWPLADVLAACGTRMLVNVEIKNLDSEPDFDPTMAIVEATVEEIRLLGGDPSRWLISSFSWATIDHCRRVAREFATAALCTTVSDSAIERVARAGHAALHPDAGAVDTDLVERCHALGLALNAWTVNEPERIVELQRLGVDGVHTDVPDRALAALGRAGGAVTPRWGTRG
jgi:glycerophosphoryl diester phosphodiesterase